MPSKRLLLAEDSSECCNEFFVGAIREDNSSILEHVSNWPPTSTVGAVEGDGDA